jgi:hypothetical protein
MDAFLPSISYQRHKIYPLQTLANVGVNSAANSGCPYLIMAETCSRQLRHSVFYTEVVLTEINTYLLQRFGGSRLQGVTFQMANKLKMEGRLYTSLT